MIKNSSGKITGNIEISEDAIKITNGKKPFLEINDADLIAKIIEKDRSVIINLYDDYTLIISEIVALYGTNYSNMNKYIKTLNVKSKPLEGRRNPSYGQTFSEERRKHIGQSKIGIYPEWLRYERTPEIRQRISETLKEGYKSGRIVMNTKALS